MSSQRRSILSLKPCATCYAERGYGITPTKDTPPTAFSPLLFTLEVDIIINNLQSGDIYGFQYTSILPERKPTFSDGTEPYQFSDFIYFVIP